MSESRQLVTLDKKQEVIKVPQERFLVITKPAEVGGMQASMLNWCQGKLESCRGEHVEGSEALEQARANKWNTKRIRGMVNRQRKRVQFYEKVVAALESGYHLVPATNDCAMFAVRAHDRDNTYPREQTSRYKWPTFAIEPQVLDLGDGEYVSDELTKSGPHFREREGKDDLKYWASDDFRDVEFPLAAAKPQLMEPTAKAMKTLIFDEIGIVPGQASKDPWIVGRIVDPRNKERHSFMIAWYTDREMVFR